MLRVTALVLLLARALLAQEPAPPPAAILKYAGPPIRVPVECGQDDLSALRLTCPAARPCPVYLDLGKVEPAGRRLFITGNLHVEDATLFSILLASDDGGSTWREPYQRIRGAGLDQIQFLESETGWASGESLGAIPRDPFLLLTRDGGVTWNSYPVVSEGLSGTIDSFHFDSKTHGRLWIGRPLAGEPANRYESYESQDGGETWVLREASAKPFPQSSHPASAPGYRLRTDRATGSYRVEHHTPSGWQAVASFLVHAGECHEPELAPTPDPEATQP